MFTEWYCILWTFQYDFLNLSYKIFLCGFFCFVSFWFLSPIGPPVSPSRKPSVKNSFQESWRICVHNVLACCYGKIFELATEEWLGESEPESSIWTSPHCILYTDCSNAVWASQLSFLQNRDSVWEVGRCRSISWLLLRPKKNKSNECLPLQYTAISKTFRGRHNLDGLSFTHFTALQ